MASVKVAVRVRPFDIREKNLNCECIVEVEENKISLLPLKAAHNTAQPRRDEIKEFCYDYSYSSYNQTSSNFATQEMLYNDLGKSVVENVLEGFNACVFAYGQTGSGKTYTMMGSKSDPGLIPKICEALFANIEEGRETGSTYKVQVSFLEIYNEKVKDLLIPHSNKVPLRVREDQNHRPFVENLSQHIVRTFSDIHKLIEMGNQHRTTASTKMNDTSSRSHTIFTITFIQAKLENETPVETMSKINLVDLAGSERASSSGTSGDTLTEGSHINKSLVTLGLVISNLADKCKKTQKGQSVHIPYRNSVLTWLLKDSLGGNSKTIMIATISPASVNHGETLSTLRYANRAKNILNKPVVNEDPKTKLIRQLREEIARLLQFQENLKLDKGLSEKDGTIMEELIDKQAREKELTDQWTEKWRQTQEILQEQKTLGLKKTGESGHGVTLYSDKPHVVVVDSKVFPGGVSVFILKEGINTVGTSETQDIHLEGFGILEEHCVITLTDSGVILKPNEGAEIYLDGEDIKENTSLNHGHTLLLGANNVLRFNNPEKASEMAKLDKLKYPMKKHLRDSFLSRSTTDLYRSQDDMSRTMEDSPLRLHRTVQDDSCLSYFKPTNASYCEMATQTSLNSIPSQQNSLIIENGQQPSDNGKLNLSLPVEKTGSSSCDSTAASDTFYTATSTSTPNHESNSSGTTDACIGTDGCNQLMNCDFTSPIYPIRTLALTNLNSPNGLLGAFTSTPTKCRDDQSMAVISHASQSAASKDVRRDLFKEKENFSLVHGGERSEFFQSAASKDVRRDLFKEKENSSLVHGGERSEFFQSAASKDVRRDLFKCEEKENSSLVHEGERSEFFQYDKDISEAFKMIHNNDNSEEQTKGQKKLHEFYTKLEDRFLRDRDKLGSVEESSNKENLPQGLDDLLIEQKLLKEERIAVLIEREIERRVAEELNKRLVAGSCPESGSSRMSYHSPDSDSETRSLSTPQSDGYECEGSNVSTEEMISPYDDIPSPLDTEYVISNGISISIPRYELRGAGSATHWKYEIKLRAGDDTWTVFRRYRRFRELHKSLCYKYGPVIEGIYFPPRRIFGNYCERVIEERRRQLEAYLRKLLAICCDLEGSPLCDVEVSRQILVKFSPFFQQSIFEGPHHSSS